MERTLTLKYDTEVREISRNEAKELVDKYHYLGGKTFMFKKAFGLFDLETGTLIGAAVYSPVTGIVALKSWFGLSNQEGDGVLELIRLVVNPAYQTEEYKNVTSFLLGRSLRLLKSQKYRGVVSLADSSRHVGTIYKACNFKYYGLTDKKTDFYREDGKLNPRGETKNQRGVWLPRSRKHRYFFSLDNKLIPVLEEQPFPVFGSESLECCKGTNVVWDYRFDVTYTCPRCVGSIAIVEKANA